MPNDKLTAKVGHYCLEAVGNQESVELKFLIPNS